MVAVLTMQRLRLRPRTMADLEACVAMDLDPDVHRFIYSQPPIPQNGARSVRAHRRRMADQRRIWVVEWQDDPGFLGWCGLFPLEDSGLIEIGYRYVTSAWGRGSRPKRRAPCWIMAFARCASIRSSRSPIRPTSPAARARENRAERLRQRVSLRPVAALLPAEPGRVSVRGARPQGSAPAGPTRP